MKKDLFRAEQILNRDRLVAVTSLPDLISREVSDRLENFIEVNSCTTKLKVEKNGEIEILIAIKSSGIKTT